MTCQLASSHVLANGAGCGLTRLAGFGMAFGFFARIPASGPIISPEVFSPKAVRNVLMLMPGDTTSGAVRFT